MVRINLLIQQLRTFIINNLKYICINQQHKNLLFAFLASFTVSYYACFSNYSVFVSVCKGLSVRGGLWDSSSYLILNFFCLKIWFSLIISTTLKNRFYMLSPVFADIVWYVNLCFYIIFYSFFLSKFLLLYIKYISRSDLFPHNTDIALSPLLSLNS